MTRSVTGAAWIINVFKGLHQADSGGAHVGIGQSLIVDNKFAAGANIRLRRLSAMHSECGGPVLKAHQQLDKAVDAAYGRKTFASEAERVAFLFQRYQAITSLLAEDTPSQRRKATP